MDRWIKDLEYDGETEKGKSDIVKAAINGLAGIWRKHNGKLHDMLQGKNIWLIEKGRQDAKIKKYFEHFSSIHQNNG
jgi:hypothetical protein